jgi:hypothetical protein
MGGPISYILIFLILCKLVVIGISLQNIRQSGTASQAMID